MLQIFYWLLLLLLAIGYFVTLNPNLARAHNVIVLILFAILGLKVFGNPIKE